MRRSFDAISYLVGTAEYDHGSKYYPIIKKKNVYLLKNFSVLFGSLAPHILKRVKRKIHIVSSDQEEEANIAPVVRFFLTEQDFLKPH